MGQQEPQRQAVGGMLCGIHMGKSVDEAEHLLPKEWVHSRTGCLSPSLASMPRL